MMKTELVKVFDSVSEARDRIPDGTQCLVRIDQKNICLVRLGQEFYAVENECAHMGHSLVKGKLNPFHEIVCPWHSYRFNLITGEESAFRCRKLKVFPVVLNSEGLLIKV